MLECVVNVSEGSRPSILDALAGSCAGSLLDVHTDTHHNRTVLTLAGSAVVKDVRSLARCAVDLLDIRRHQGAHPRIGVIDVVPFVPLPDSDSTLEDSVRERTAFAQWMGETMQVPCFFYGSERSLPDVRRHAFGSLVPDTGPRTPHTTAGACAVGARDVLIAYNVWLEGADLTTTKQIAAAVRRPGIRTLGLDVGGRMQVSCNLVEPKVVGPADAYDVIAHEASEYGCTAGEAELVGLLPQSILATIDPRRWKQLDVGEHRTIEKRLRS